MVCREHAGGLQVLRSLWGLCAGDTYYGQDSVFLCSVCLPDPCQAPGKEPGLHGMLAVHQPVLLRDPRNHDHDLFWAPGEQEPRESGLHHFTGERTKALRDRGLPGVWQGCLLPSLMQESLLFGPHIFPYHPWVNQALASREPGRQRCLSASSNYLCL